MKADRLRMHRPMTEAATPAWMVTYADLVTLLLCLFVGMLSMSAIKPELFQHAVGSLRGAFGAPGHTPFAGIPDESFYGVFEREIEILRVPTGDGKAAAGLPWTSMSRLPHGISIRLAGTNMFDRGEGTLRLEGREMIAKIAALCAVRVSKIKITGHCSEETKDRSEERNLSYLRAASVAEILEKGGMPAAAIRVEALVDSEPLVSHAYTAQRKEQNRGVVIEIEEAEMSEGGPWDR